MNNNVRKPSKPQLHISINNSSLSKTIFNDSYTIKRSIPPQNAIAITRQNNEMNSSVQSLRSMMNSIKLLEVKKRNKHQIVPSYTCSSNDKPIPSSLTFEDLSNIRKKEKFTMEDNIDNSLFNDYDDWRMSTPHKAFPQEPFTSSNNTSQSNSSSENAATELSDIYKDKIQNASSNEEIVLPNTKLTMNFLVISKPITLKGQIGSCLEITEGPIMIRISENSENDSVKISQLKILFNDSDLNKSNNIKNKTITNLFKLFPGSLLELEDCDIIYQNRYNNSNNIHLNPSSSNHPNTKSVAFLLFPCESSLLTSVLTITNTRVTHFYQTIRCGHNCILNINKSSISHNYGKSVVILNPLIVKVNETTFDKCVNGGVHIKFIEEGHVNAHRKIYIYKNTFETSMANAICLEGNKSLNSNLIIALRNNIFRYFRSDGVIIWDLNYNVFDISGNTFHKNKGNGLNIQRVVSVNSNSNNKEECSVKIKDNTFTENGGFGLFVNDAVIDAVNNKYIRNKESGMILCNLMLDNPRAALKVFKSDNFSLNLLPTEWCTNEALGYVKAENSSSNNNNNNNMNTKSIIGNNSSQTQMCSYLTQNNFYENSGCGLKIINYNYRIIADTNSFRENCEHGIYIDLDSNTSINVTSTPSATRIEKIKQFKNSEHLQATALANLMLVQCIVESNVKSGISLNNCFVFCEECYIVNNMGFAVYTTKREFANCFKESKVKGKKNQITGTLGGEWGEINLNSQVGCNVSCKGSSNVHKNKKAKIESDIPNNNMVNTLNDIDVEIKDALSLKERDSCDIIRKSNINYRNKDNKKDNKKEENCDVF